PSSWRNRRWVDRCVVDRQGEARDLRVLIRVVGGLVGACDRQRRVGKAARDPLERNGGDVGQPSRHRLEVPAGGGGVGWGGGRRAWRGLRGVRTKHLACVWRDRERDRTADGVGRRGRQAVGSNYAVLTERLGRTTERPSRRRRDHGERWVQRHDL